MNKNVMDIGGIMSKGSERSLQLNCGVVLKKDV